MNKHEQIIIKYDLNIIEIIMDYDEDYQKKDEYDIQKTKKKSI
jgi:hypothetical protein